MLYMSFFVEVDSEKHVENVITSTFQSLQSQIIEYKINSIEVYDKFDNWYKVRCDLELKSHLTYEIATQFLLMISDKWDWNGGKSSAHSCARTMNAKFINTKIKFVSCHIEY